MNIPDHYWILARAIDRTSPWAQRSTRTHVLAWDPDKKLFLCGHSIASALVATTHWEDGIPCSKELAERILLLCREHTTLFESNINTKDKEHHHTTANRSVCVLRYSGAQHGIGHHTLRLVALGSLSIDFHDEQYQRQTVSVGSILTPVFAEKLKGLNSEQITSGIAGTLK